jgi:hypothetical protein
VFNEIGFPVAENKDDRDGIDEGIRPWEQR